MQRIQPGGRLAVFAIVGALAGIAAATLSVTASRDAPNWGTLLYAAPVGAVVGALWAAAVWLVVGIVVASSRRLRPSWIGPAAAVVVGTGICTAVGLAPNPLESSMATTVLVALLGLVGSSVEAVVRSRELPARAA